MQTLYQPPVVPADFLEPVQQMRYRLEVYDGTEWQDLTALGTTRNESGSLVDSGTSGAKDYLKHISVSLGGAGMDPAPIAGTWSATIDNESGIFHPRHPTSAYAGLLRVGREVRVSIGAEYGGVDYFWQRLIGFMDAPKFNQGSRTVQLSGMDYMSLLANMILRDVNPIAESGSIISGSAGSGSGFADDIINGPLHWGRVAVFASVASPGGSGIELYDGADACEIGAGEADNVTNWVVTGGGTVTSEGPSPTSAYYLQFVRDADYPAADSVLKDDVGDIVAGGQYRITFRASRTPDYGYCRMMAYGTPTSYLGACNISGSTWKTYSIITSVVPASGPLQLKLETLVPDALAGDTIWIDDISIQFYDPLNWMRYVLPATCNGPYYVTINGAPIGQGDQGGVAEEGGGWHYVESSHSLFFNQDMVIDAGLPILIYYYTNQVLENVLADLMVWSGLGVDRAWILAELAPLASPGITLGRVWFEAGDSALSAVQKICERVNYRFWFAYDGRPRFQPAPVFGAVDLTLPEPGHLRDISEFQDDGMVRNRIAIEGCDQVMYQVSSDDKASDRFKDETSDPVSILAYLEKTYSINNHLFQDQASITAMCAVLLAEFKDPKWYADLQLFANPAPLELGDVIEWPLELEPLDADPGSISGPESGGLEITMSGIIRDIKLNDAQANYKVEIHGDPFVFGPYLYYTSMNNNNVVRVLLSDFATDSVWMPGPGGAADGEFSGARQIADDGTYLYVADDLNGRVQKFVSATGAFVAHTAPGDVVRPWGCVYWAGKLYVSSETGAHVIYILDAVTLAVITQFGTGIGSGNTEFNQPRGMATDGVHLYICDNGNNRIKKHTLVGGYVAQVGHTGTGDGEFNGMSACSVDGEHLFVTDFGNKRVQKFNCSDLSFVSSIPTQVRGGTAGNPTTITINGTYFYVGCGYIEKYLKSTDAFIAFFDQTIGGVPAPGTMWGSCILKEPA